MRMMNHKGKNVLIVVSIIVVAAIALILYLAVTAKTKSAGIYRLQSAFEEFDIPWSDDYEAELIDSGEAAWDGNEFCYTIMKESAPELTEFLSEEQISYAEDVYDGWVGHTAEFTKGTKWSEFDPSKYDTAFASRGSAGGDSIILLLRDDDERIWVWLADY